jgi:hypothetical protein
MKKLLALLVSGLFSVTVFAADAAKPVDAAKPTDAKAAPTAKPADAAKPATK